METPRRRRQGERGKEEDQRIKTSREIEAIRSIIRRRIKVVKV